MTEQPRILPSKLFTEQASNYRGRLQVWDKLPFTFVRVFTIRNVPFARTRGQHAHRTCHQVLHCTQGAFVAHVTGDTGQALTYHMLDDAALYIPPMNWIHLDGFSADAHCSVYCSEPYNQRGVIESFEVLQSLWYRALDQELGDDWQDPPEEVAGAD